MTCLSCRRARSKDRAVTNVTLPSGAVAPLCDECAADDYRIAHAERKVAGGE